jgi:hypothetical protein
MEGKSSLISAPQPLVSGLGVQGLAPTTRCKRNMVEGDGRTPAPADFTLGGGDDYLSAGRAFIDGNGNNDDDGDLQLTGGPRWKRRFGVGGPVLRPVLCVTCGNKDPTQCCGCRGGKKKIQCFVCFNDDSTFCCSCPVRQDVRSLRVPTARAAWLAAHLPAIEVGEGDERGGGFGVSTEAERELLDDGGDGWLGVYISWR